MQIVYMHIIDIIGFLRIILQLLKFILVNNLQKRLINLSDFFSRVCDRSALITAECTQIFL